MLKHGAKPVAERGRRKTYDSLDANSFFKPNIEEEKKEPKCDEKMDDGFQDVTA